MEMRASGNSARIDPLDRIIGDSPAILALKAEIQRVASKDVPVLLVGQSGTGKELVARALHELSPRCASPYVIVHSAAIPATLFESEFFGYAPGAFTGAHRHGKRGRIEQAHTGTLLLDEIGDMPIEVQVKLLRVLQDGRFERLGSHAQMHSDFRLISATHRDIVGLVRQERFRLDLYYRVGAVTLRVPSLAERRSDIPRLAETFLTEFAARHGIAHFELCRSAQDFLMSHPWPGNVRQLKHEVEKAAIFADGHCVRVGDFRMVRCSEAGSPEPELPRRPGATVREAVDEVALTMIRDALNRCRGNKRRAAAELGISRGYLYKCIASAGLHEPQQSDPPARDVVFAETDAPQPMDTSVVVYRRGSLRRVLT